MAPSDRIETGLRGKLGKVAQGERLRDQIYDYIRGELRFGLLGPGDRLKEVALAERLGVSRTPVREALFQLARDGLLEELAHGYQLPEHTQQALRDRMEIRVLMEPRIARHAAVAATARQRARLRRALEREEELVASDDAQKFIAANLDWKTELFAMCGNRLLVRSAQLFDDQFQFSRRKAFAIAANRAITVARHREICDAVDAGDGDAAEAAMRALLQTASEFHAADTAAT
jgi:GntR family transcriptional regulator, rspAB operon transcriptional repressor